MDKPTSVSDYLSHYEGVPRERLDHMRQLIMSLVPDAEERTSYGILGYKVKKGFIIYLGTYAKHVALYPVPQGDAQFHQDLAPYLSGKSTMRFVHSEPLPEELIKRIIHFAQDR